MTMDERFIRNIPSISEEEQELIASKRILVAGCGGLGGYVSEYLARLGITHITVLDCDYFEESNINRQLLAASSTIEKSKAETSKERILSINPNADAVSVKEFLSEKNAASIVRDHDLVIDALDSVDTRLILEEACAKSGITIIHGAVHGWCFQVAVVPPGSGILKRLYGRNRSSESKTILSFVPPCCAAVQVSEALLNICGRPGALQNKVLFYNMETLENTLITI